MLIGYRCKVCGAPVDPETGYCEYCGTDNSPRFKGEFTESIYGTITFRGEPIDCWITEVEIEEFGTIFSPGEQPRLITKRTFTIKEF